jgi:GH24 family phage-related lysozyme (muramidase)
MWFFHANGEEEMDISPTGITLIQSFEGKHKLRPDGKYQAYLDTLAKPPVWTVYCGLTKGTNKDTCITVEQGDAMFAKELAVYEDAVERVVTVPLNQSMLDALTSVVYNCGPGVLEKSTLLNVLIKASLSRQRRAPRPQAPSGPCNKYVSSFSV